MNHLYTIPAPENIGAVITSTPEYMYPNRGPYTIAREGILSNA